MSTPPMPPGSGYPQGNPGYPQAPQGNPGYPPAQGGQFAQPQGGQGAQSGGFPQPPPGIQPQGGQFPPPPQDGQFGQPQQGGQFPPPAGGQFAPPPGQNPPPGGQFGPPPGGQFPPQQGVPPMAPPAAPMPIAPAPAPKKRNVFVRIAISIVTLLVIAGGVYVFNYLTSSAAQSKVGDCANISGKSTNAKIDIVDCSNASYKIAKKLSSTSDSCPDTGYSSYLETGRRSPTTKLCLMPNLTEGGCYKVTGNSIGEATKVACGSPSSAKITKVTADANGKCAETEATLNYPEPPTTFCAVLTK